MVLFVDGDLGVREEFREFLEDERDEFEVKFVSSAEEGLELLDEFCFDCIVSDYRLVGMDGLDFLDVVKSENGINIPFIVFTGDGGEEVAMEALNNGADRYIQKKGGLVSQYSALADAVIEEYEDKMLEKEAERERERMESLMDLSPDLVYFKDDEHKLVRANRAYTQLMRSREEDILGKTARELWPNEAEDIIEDEKIVLGGEPVVGRERRVTLPNGEERWYLIYKIPMYDDQGNVIGFFSVDRDITKRKRFEKELRRSEREKSLILDSTKELISYQRRDHELKWVNKAWYEKFGGENESIEGERCYEYLYGSNEPCEGCPVDKVFETGESIKTEITGQAGRTWLASVNPVRNDDEEVKGVIQASLEITDRIEREGELKRSKKRFENLIKESPVGVVIPDFEEDITFVNESFAQMLGYEKTELIGKNLSEITTEEEFKKMKNKTKERKKGEKESYESKFIKKDGTILNVIIGATPHYNLKGEIIGTVVFIQNITERKKAEEKENFLHSILRHEVKNKIQLIKGYLDLCKDHDKPQEVEKYFTKADKATKESINLIKKVNTMREIEKEEIKEVNVGIILDKIINENRPRAQDKNITIEYEKINCRVLGGSLLREMFSNILKNSLIHSKCQKIKITGKKRENRYLITIEDDGIGIPKKQKEKIFKKGYKKGEKSGHGLGMYLAKKIIKNYNGKIEVKDSKLGGAKFNIILKKPKKTKIN
ncbi:MAG: Signal transduction histidine kinase containing PAS domain [Candidatus Methanohalarchaeum thermophilum]|uniref:histidine kinase n=1 Tax=Methanohalarchaeum thermophilum TaxID=1903181 RepID=A0A1Q6DTS6_METT1|nr:MAG: Signal transduction histidine kinase containing PAS domain [Candidatus Methanohalarchaeum thermophilum]